VYAEVIDILGFPGGHSNLLRVGQVQLRVNGYMAELGVDIYN